MKKFFTVIISIILFFGMISFTTLLSARSILSRNNISKVLSVAMGEEDIKNYIKDVINNADNDFSQYINIEEFSKELSYYTADYIKYLVLEEGKTPSSESLKRVMEDAISKYEKESNVVLDRQEIDNIFEEFDKEMEEENAELFDEETKEVLKFIYNDSYLIALGISIVCLIAIVLINRNVLTVCTSLGVVTIINGIIIWLLAILLQMLFSSEEELVGVSKIFSSPFKITGIVCLGLGIVLLVIKSFIKNKKKEVLM